MQTPLVQVSSMSHTLPHCAKRGGKQRRETRTRFLRNSSSLQPALCHEGSCHARAAGNLTEPQLSASDLNHQVERHWPAQKAVPWWQVLHSYFPQRLRWQLAPQRQRLPHCAHTGEEGRGLMAPPAGEGHLSACD